MPIRKFSLRAEEMPVVGEFLLKSLEIDFATFQEYSPDFNSEYKLKFKTKLETVDSIINPKKLQNELKKVTENMYASAEGLRKPLLLLEGYVNRAENLTISSKDFGITDVRKKISNKDQEALLEKLKNLFQNIDDNLESLKVKGFTLEAYNELKATRDFIKTANQNQNEKSNAKQKLVEDNIELFNELWNIMKDVMDTGKRLAKNNSKMRSEDYTTTKLKSRVRHEKAKTDLTSVLPIENPNNNI